MHRGIRIALGLCAAALLAPGHAGASWHDYDESGRTANSNFILWGASSDADASASADGALRVDTSASADYSTSLDLGTAAIGRGAAEAAAYVGEVFQGFLEIPAGSGRYDVTANVYIDDYGIVGNPYSGGYYGYAASSLYAQLYVYAYNCSYTYYGDYQCATDAPPVETRAIACAPVAYYSACPAYNMQKPWGITLSTTVDFDGDHPSSYIYARVTLYARSDADRYGTASVHAVGSATDISLAWATWP